MVAPKSYLAPRGRNLLLGILLLLAVAAWVVLIRQARMADGAAMDQNALTMGMSAPLFLLVWIVMMVAMMFPAVAPMVLAFASVTRARGESYPPTAAFVGGYLVVWAAAGLVPLAVITAVDAAWMAPPAWLGRVGALAVIAAGIYQFTPLKDVCLRACRSPLGFVITHDFGRGVSSAFRAGASHGLYCLGCCWALMVVLAVIGLMNIAWMAVIAAVFFIEKNVPFGDMLPKAVGVACIVGGVALLIV